MGQDGVGMMGAKKFKVKKIIDSIREKFPSHQWKYNPSAQWYESQDGSRVVMVASGTDHNGEYDGNWCWYVYWADKAPERIYFSEPKES